MYIIGLLSSGVFNGPLLDVGFPDQGGFSLLNHANQTGMHRICFKFSYSPQWYWPTYFAPLVVFYNTYMMNRDGSLCILYHNGE